MYEPSLRYKKNGVPVISKKEINKIGEDFVRDFCPKALIEPMGINIDRFAEGYLGVTEDFQYLSHCGCYLGMTVFNDTDMVPVYNPETNTAEFISAKAGTIILDNNLLAEDQEHRYRFTVGHEAAHHILHQGYFSYDENQFTLFDERAPMIKCRVDNSKTSNKPVKEWNDHDTMEWQANYLSSAILMPKQMVDLVVESNKDKSYLDIVFLVSKIFNVSVEAAKYRVFDCGYVQADTTFS